MRSLKLHQNLDFIARFRSHVGPPGPAPYAASPDGLYEGSSASVQLFVFSCGFGAGLFQRAIEGHLVLGRRSGDSESRINDSVDD